MNPRTILFLACCGHALLASGSTDSLLHALHAQPMDTTRYGTLRALIQSNVLRQPDSALAWARQYERIAIRAGDQRGLAYARSKRGHALLVKGRHAEALPYFLDVLPAFERSGNDRDLAMILGNIGEIHSHQGNWRKARDAYLRAHEAFVRAGSIMWMAGTSESLAHVYEAMGQPDSAYAWYARTVDIMEEVGAGDHARDARVGQAGILLQRGEEGKALDLYRHALHLEENASNDLVKCLALIDLGRLCMGTNRLAEADSAIDQALRLAKERGFDAECAAALLARSELQERAGQPLRALTSLREHLVWKDSLFNQRNSALIAEAQERYESERKDAELAAKGALLQRKSIILYALIAITFVLLCAAILVFIAYRSRKRLSEELAQRNSVAHAALRDKELLLRELHHRVKNNMQTVGSLLRLQARGEPDEGTRVALHEAMMRVKSLALVHQDLYRDASLTSVRMDEYVTKLANGLLKSHAMEQRVALSLDVDQVRLEVDSAVPLGLILNELITNALKHAFPAGSNRNVLTSELAVMLRDNDDVLVLEVRDNGIGFEPSGAARMAQRGHLSGTGILDTFAEALRAEWTVINAHGTTVRFAIRNFTRA